MRRVRDQLPAVAGALVVVMVAVAVAVLLRDAQSSGRESLEQAKAAQVEAVANSLDVRIGSALRATSGLAVNRWELTPGSEADRRLLASFLGPDSRTGFFLLDDRDRITQGVLLPAGAIGSSFNRAGWSTVRQSPAFKAGAGVILPVDRGLTTSAATYALALPILDAATRTMRGTFIFEADVTADSEFNDEIAQLRRPGSDTEDYFLLDSGGIVIASTDAGALAKPIDDGRYRALRAGRHELDGRLIVVADVPAASWRLIQRQDRSEFESGLTDPLQTAGIVILVLLSLVGAFLVAVVLRRLRLARAEAVRLQELADSQEEFISIVSHELRTPVAGVLGFLQTTLDHWTLMSDDDRRDAVVRAARNARRLQAMTRDVLDTEAIDAGALTFVFERVDLRDEADTAVVAARDLYPEREIRLDVPADTVPVNVDPDRVQQVFRNLLDNALRNSPASEPVTVNVRVEDGTGVVEVRDRGGGIDEATAERLFEKFVRGRNQDVTGTGLGLYITRKLIEAHAGTITASAAPDLGAVFTFHLPLADVTASSPVSSLVTAPGDR